MPADPTREDSGLIDLDALMREARESGPLPTADESGERLVVRPAPAPAPAPEPAPAPVPVRASVTLPPPPTKRGVLPVAGAMVLAVALATGAFFWTTRRPHAAEPSVAIATTASAPPTPAATASPASSVERGTIVDELPAVASAASSSVPPTATTTAPIRAHATAQPARVALSEVAAEATPNTNGDLGRAMHDAVGARDDAKQESNAGTSSGGARQLRPSPGAVVGAINAVLPAARACLGPDDPVRSGLLVFRADGTVARVDLRGERPQDECVRTVMARARIEPFADDTFTTRITIRP